ncbi:MAG: hypothetical protein L0Y67_09280 [Gammaproteobacteria bacterium]|nr:hypothetical protein [Gammaproteobacteria bacterium]
MNHKMLSRSGSRLVLLALMAGATGIAFAPIFVRVSEVWPVTTAFYRLLFALPALWLWSSIERNSNQTALLPQSAGDHRDLAPAFEAILHDCAYSSTAWRRVTAPHWRFG